MEQRQEKQTWNYKQNEEGNERPYSAVCGQEFDAAMKTWDKIDDPEKKVKLFISLLPYAAPRLSNITVNDSSGNDIVRQMLEQQK